jgi:hypothetical protein
MPIEFSIAIDVSLLETSLQPPAVWMNPGRSQVLQQQIAS